MVDEVLTNTSTNNVHKKNVVMIVMYRLGALNTSLTAIKKPVLPWLLTRRNGDFSYNVPPSDQNGSHRSEKTSSPASCSEKHTAE